MILRFALLHHFNWNWALPSFPLQSPCYFPSPSDTLVGKSMQLSCYYNRLFYSQSYHIMQALTLFLKFQKLCLPFSTLVCVQRNTEKTASLTMLCSLSKGINCPFLNSCLLQAGFCPPSPLSDLICALYCVSATPHSGITLENAILIFLKHWWQLISGTASPSKVYQTSHNI